MTTCSNGTPSTSNCSNSYSCKGNTCGTCNNNTTSCSNNSSAVGQLTTCSNGTPSTSDCSNSYSCKGNTCGTCNNNTTSCSNNSSAVGQLTTCSNGTPSTSDCSNSYSCKSSSACGSCKNGTHNCSSNIYQTCGTGQWNNTQTCTAPENGSATCSASTGCGITCNSPYQPYNGGCVIHECTLNAKKCESSGLTKSFCTCVDNGTTGYVWDCSDCPLVVGGTATCNETTGCGYTCTFNYSDCGSSVGCVDLDNNRLHCGSCGHACGTDEICQEGSCVTDPCVLIGCTGERQYCCDASTYDDYYEMMEPAVCKTCKSDEECCGSDGNYYCDKLSGGMSCFPDWIKDLAPMPEAGGVYCTEIPPDSCLYGVHPIL